MAYAAKEGRSGVGLLLLSKGEKGSDKSEGEGMSEEDYKAAKAEGAKAFLEAATGGDWEAAGEALEKVIHLCVGE